MATNKTVLITGGAGFIGSHLTDRFLKDGYRVKILDNLDPKIHPHALPEHTKQQIQNGVEFIQGEASNLELLKKALAGVDVVSVQAAYQDYLPDFGKFFESNAVGTARVFEAIVAEKLPVEKVIVASSQSVYGDGQFECKVHGFFQANPRAPEQLERGDWEVHCPQCNTASQPLLLKEEYANPVGQYAISKYTQELITLRIGKLYGIPTVALRYSIVQGPRQSLYNRYSGALRIFANNILNNVPPPVYEDGLQQRDFVHVQDVVDAHMLVLALKEANWQAFNVATGQPITMLEYANLLIKKIGKQLTPLVQGEYRAGDNRHSVSDITKLKALGWEPKRSLEQIFDDFLRWVDSIGGFPKLTEDHEAIMRKLGVLRKATKI